MTTNTAAPAEPGNRRILLVEDEKTIAGVVRDYLLKAGFQVDTAEDGFTALELAASRQPDLVILDRMLPGLDGVEVCRRLRQSMSVPVIMVTALGTEDDRILGLEMGADDYVTKPFSPRELVLRVKSVLRRSIKEFTPEPPVEVAGLELDPASRTVTHRGVPLALTVREFDLLAFLMRRPNQVFSREELIKAVWGWDFGDLSTVTVHVRRLREKIEANPTKPELLKTVWGVGYRFDTKEAASASAGPEAVYAETEGDHGRQ
ncbi:response regulator transcription factor [Paenarthrobacter aurescens]|uniref:response regulator transcription factor n=1 Tax=Paenarthrobacter aurescens TaxID=43663 RepID=UPI001143309B|nr:response regulator transcription factor [Paenarthrobacter aurescens]MDO6143089.1 response regulator transcription factor [Paenarthrobacter aurescens]MDO6146934.1 response regulator transcription factor [Paenarthrobacter aurescens]MDO6158180.1 response regulator transcription factor [Paenarthrobacter aurescens]MDO6162165.1 response regulator transcription factor [Paenarthrobacter aurescens]